MDDNSPDITGNTGKNDPSSIWGGLLNTATTLGTTALNNRIQGGRQPAGGAVGTPASSAAPGGGVSKYVWWAVGGFAVLLLVGFLFIGTKRS